MGRSCLPSVPHGRLYTQRRGERLSPSPTTPPFCGEKGQVSCVPSRNDTGHGCRPDRQCMTRHEGMQTTVSSRRTERLFANQIRDHDQVTHRCGEPPAPCTPCLQPHTAGCRCPRPGCGRRTCSTAGGDVTGAQPLLRCPNNTVHLYLLLETRVQRRSKRAMIGIFEFQTHKNVGRANDGAGSRRIGRGVQIQREQLAGTDPRFELIAW